jgi:hypothetical protein
MTLIIPTPMITLANNFPYCETGLLHCIESCGGYGSAWPAHTKGTQLCPRSVLTLFFAILPVSGEILL